MKIFSIIISITLFLTFTDLTFSEDTDKTQWKYSSDLNWKIIKNDNSFITRNLTNGLSYYTKGKYVHAALDTFNNHLNLKFLVIRDENGKEYYFNWLLLGAEHKDFLISWFNNTLPEDFDPTKWTYFCIHVNIHDDPIFKQLKEDLKIVDPDEEKFSVVINITDSNPINQYIHLGEKDDDPDAVYMRWGNIRKSVQEGLINWDGKNKINLNTPAYNLPFYFETIKRVRVKPIEISDYWADKLYGNIYPDSAEKWNYYVIYADRNEDTIFNLLPAELNLKLKRDNYLVFVDRRTNITTMQTVTITDGNTEPVTYNWYNLSKKVRDGLTNWDKENKWELDGNEIDELNYNDYSESRFWKKFIIFVNTSDNKLFNKIREKFNKFDREKYYVLIVNLNFANEDDQYIVLRDTGYGNWESLSWKQLDLGTRNFLLNWNKKNKIKIDN